MGLPETVLEFKSDARFRIAMRIYGAAYLAEKEDPVSGQRHPEPGWCWERASPVQQEFCLKQADAALDELVKILFESKAAALQPRP